MRSLLRNFVALSLIFSTALAKENVVNVYMWSDVIPDSIIQQFEKDTGIKVNFSTYDSNEIMYAKLRAGKNPGYDVVEPSSYYIDRMRRQNMLEKLDRNKMTNFKNINPAFLHQAYDPQSNYSIPFTWGVTGIFINKDYYNKDNVSRWSDLWDKKYADELLILNDSREAFSAALRTLGYSVNDSNPEHIKLAYQKLKELIPNVKIFNSEPLSVLIDEDTNIGMVWNGDLYKASRENPQLEFIYPKDGFVIWVDNFAIPKDAPHRANAYKFLNYVLRADIAKQVALYNNYPTPNLAGQKLLPDTIKNNPTVYPPHDVLKRGEFQTDIGDEALALYEKYWERLKMGG